VRPVVVFPCDVVNALCGGEGVDEGECSLIVVPMKEMSKHLLQGELAGIWG